MLLLYEYYDKENRDSYIYFWDLNWKIMFGELVFKIK